MSGKNSDEISEALRNESDKGNEKTPDYLNCQKICEYQKELLKDDQEFSKAIFHMPEPWSGNLRTAKILFVGSNPSIDLNEDFPKFESEEWPDDRVVNFFSGRLDKLENLNSKYWTWILKFAGCILEIINPIRTLDKKNDEEKNKIRDIASRIALTEIVHCKSKTEKEGKVSEAAKTCFALPKDEDTNNEDNYTTAVIKYFLETRSGSGEEESDSGKKKTVVFLGEIARERIYALAEKKKFNIKGDPIAAFCKSEFGCQEARFFFMPHPSKVGLSHKECQERIDEQKRINKELEQYG